MASREAVIVSGVRTAIGRFGGTLKEIPTANLGAVAIKGALERIKLDPARVDEVIMGCTVQVLDTTNVARPASVFAGVPVKVPAYTVNRMCGSGLEAINSGARQIETGDAEIVVAGGCESMSNMPFALPGSARWGLKMGNATLQDSMAGSQGVLECPFNHYHMGVTAENVAEKWGVSREDQDAFSLESHKRAVAAQKAGYFKDQIVPVMVPQGKGEVKPFDTDEHPRADTSLERLAKLPTVFKKGGTVTPGNASGINDGAAAVVLMSAQKAKELGLTPRLIVRARAVAGVDPALMGIGPAEAVPLALKKAGLTLKDISVIELNEAFAAQAVAVIRELGMDPATTNPNGGAVALGHPVGATGAILAIKTMYELERRKARYGMATLCIGGGMGIATVFERP